MKIIYEPVKIKVDSKKLGKIVKDYGDAFIAFTAQYADVFKKFKNSGLVLGCDVSSINNYKGNTIIFVGDGVFHPLMIKKEYIDKKVLVLNPIDYSVKEINEADVKKFITREAMMLLKLKESKKVGVIISSKPGQERMKLAELLKKKLELEGKKVYLFLAETVNPDEFMNYSKMDLLINTACPRLALDDYEKFPTPVINYSAVLSKYFKNQ